MNPTKSQGELGCSGRVNSSCSTSGTRRVNLVTNPVISHEWGKDWEVLMTSGTYMLSLWHRYRLTVNQVMVATVKLSKWWPTSGAGTVYPSGAPEFTLAFSGIHVTRSLVLYICFVDRYLSFCTFSFGHCVVCSSSIYGFWPLCCLFFFDIRIMAIVLSVLLRYTDSGHCVVCSSITKGQITIYKTYI
jgi:hypothetical protein